MICSSLTGCSIFKNPLGSWNKAETKVATAAEKIDNNNERIITEGRNYVYATHLALKADTSTNKYHALETQMNDRAVSVLGSPAIDKVAQLESMVGNLLSENQKLVNKGESQLSVFDLNTAKLQSENTSLQAKLENAQKKLEDVGTTNSSMAQKWNTLVSYMWYFIYLIIFVAAVKILSVVLPPPYNSIVGIVAIPIGFLIKMVHSLIPEAKAAAGVVNKEYKTATEDLVTVIQKLKESHPELHTEISSTVLSNTDSTTSAKAINESKQNLGIVS